MKRLVAAVLLVAGTNGYAMDAGQLNQRCAPCHGLYGQGAPRANAPRLAGLPDWYLSKATRDYVKGARKNPLMLEVAGLSEMSEKEIGELSLWLSRQPIGNDPAYDIKTTTGDARAGGLKFEADCAECHARDGYGKKKKEAPPLAGQQPDYLLSSIKAFYRKDRYHDNDPIDDTFDDISDARARDIVAWLATQDDRKQRQDGQFHPTPLPLTVPDKAGYRVASVQQTLISTLVDKGVAPRQAIAAMLRKAAELHVPVIPQAPGDNEDLPMVVDLEFCEPRHIRKLIGAVPEIAAYGPCRITLVKRPDGAVRLMAVNLDMLIDGKQLPADKQRSAIRINQDMLAIISAGRRGAEPALPADARK